MWIMPQGTKPITNIKWTCRTEHKIDRFKEKVYISPFTIFYIYQQYFNIKH